MTAQKEVINVNLKICTNETRLHKLCLCLCLLLDIK